jgi:hypothetical protein
MLMLPNTGMLVRAAVTVSVWLVRLAVAQEQSRITNNGESQTKGL